MQYRKCVLPAGYIDEAGEVHKETELRALTGTEEELLVESDGSNPAARVSRHAPRGGGGSISAVV